MTGSPDAITLYVRKNDRWDDKSKQPQDGAASPPSVDAKSLKDWHDLLQVKCPLGGYELTEAGLSRIPSRETVDVWELRQLINDVNVLEGKARYTVDCRLGGTIERRIADGCEGIGPLALILFALYFGCFKTPKAYMQAQPSRSVLVSRYYKSRMTAQRLEQVCQQRRMLFQATSPRVLALGLSSLGCAMAAAAQYRISQPTTQFDETTKDSIVYFRHMEGALKYLWAVYYHHPVYRAHSSKERPSPMGQRL